MNFTDDEKFGEIIPLEILVFNLFLWYYGDNGAVRCIRMLMCPKLIIKAD